MNRIRTIVCSLALTLVVVAPAAAQKHPNLELGFKPDKLYQFSDIDSVNLFNGNLIVRLPIGLRYPVNADFGYQLTLVYNSKVWDYREEFESSETHYSARPNLRSNAGIGWRLSLGRLLPPTDSTSQWSSDGPHGWIYESSDGAEHAFKYPSTSTNDATVLLSDDEVPLRMIKVSDTMRTVEFPNGDVHTFGKYQSRWRLSAARDSFGNNFTVAYTQDPVDSSRDITWTIQDSVIGAVRTQVIRFHHETALNDSVDVGQVVDSITLEGVGGVDSVYTFNYAQTTMWRGCQHNALTPSATDSFIIPLLTSITLPDSEGSQFLFSYHHGTSWGNCDEAALDTLTLPTGGTVAYAYQQYYLPDTLCSETPIVAQSLGLRTKTLGSDVWDYVHDVGPQTTVDPHTLPVGSCGYQGPEVPGQPVAEIIWPRRWARTSVLSPAVDAKRTRSDNFFYVWTAGEGTLPDIWRDNDPLQPSFGKPLTTGAPSVADARRPFADTIADVQAIDETATGHRFLSTRVMQGCANDRTGNCLGGTLLQSTHLRYAFGPFAEQIVSSRTSYHDDLVSGVPAYTQTTYSDPDGAGHFRMSESASNFPAARQVTAYTNYRPWTIATMTNTATPWLLNLFTDQWQADGRKQHSIFCFDPATGFLQRTRSRADASSSSNAHDVITVYEQTPSYGNVAWEKNYGGDGQDVTASVADMCTQSLGTPVAITGYGYSGGTMSSAGLYDPVGFNASTSQPLLLRADYSIDPWTGLVTASRDVSGLATNYAYEAASARLASVTPPGGAPTTYEYHKAAAAKAYVMSTTTSATGQVLKSWVQFDAYGRVLRKAETMPGALPWSVTATLYDGLGRVKSTSEPEALAATPTDVFTPATTTSFEYDGLGRQTKVTPPDDTNHVVTTSYAGARMVTRTSKIATSTSGAEVNVATTEEYDSRGHLLRVTQSSGPTSAAAPIGAPVSTEYGYDVAGHLTSVKMTGAEEVVQNRVFDYDGRGFLRWESQPESGMTAYTYDALGKVLTKSQSAASSRFDLNYTYDAIGRLKRIDGRNPWYDPASSLADQHLTFLPMKEFEYGTANIGDDHRKGRVTKATRYNYPPKPSIYYLTYDHYVSNDIIRVGELSEYRGPGGQRTNRTTEIDLSTSLSSNSWTKIRDISQSVTYNDLGQPVTTAYPMCFDCGVPESVSPELNITPTYQAGRVSSVPSLIDSVTYWPNGMRRQLFHHNQIVDTQTLYHSMSRPGSISTGPYQSCDPAKILVQPVGGQVTSSPIHLSVVAEGTSLTYQWFIYANHSPQAIVGATNSYYDVLPTTSTEYYVEIASAGCRTVQSVHVTVTPTCVAPTYAAGSATVAADNMVTLSGGVGSPSGTTATQPFTFTWRRSSDNAVIGTAATVTTGPISANTAYYLTATSLCSNVTVTSGTISAVLPAVMTSSGLVATLAPGGNAINVTWPVVTGAVQYVLQRRSGGAWADYVTLTTNSYTDTAVVANKTYAYRFAIIDASSVRSFYSYADVATLMSFTPVAGTVITLAHFTEILAAVNSVRAAAGWSSVGWNDILSSSQPLPSPGAIVMATHILASRARMNEALQALGVPVAAYTDPDPSLQWIRAVHIQELQGRAQ